MRTRLLTFAVLSSLALSVSACSRGGRSPWWDRQDTAQAPPSPGSGQTGPGFATQVNQVNGPNNSAFAYGEQPQTKQEQKQAE
jgi:hypothetical protein